MADKNDISIKISAQDAASPVFQRFLAQLQGVQGKTDETNKKMAASFSQMAGGVAQMGAAFSTLTSGGLSGMVSGFTTLNAGLKNVTAGFGGLSKHAQVATTVFAGMVAGATAIGGAMFELAKKAANTGDNLRDLSMRVGVSVEKLSTLSIIASTAGASTADLTTGLRFLSRNLSQAQEEGSEMSRIFKILGIDTKQSTEQAFLALGDALRKLPTDADRVAVSYAVLGKGGAALLPMFENGGKAVGEFQEKLKAMGLEVSTNSANAGDRMNDSFRLMQVIFEAVTRKLGEGLVPKFAELAETLVRTFGNPKVMEGITSLGQSLVTIFEGVVGIVGKLAEMYAWLVRFSELESEQKSRVSSKNLSGRYGYRSIMDEAQSADRRAIEKDRFDTSGIFSPLAVGGSVFDRGASIFGGRAIGQGTPSGITGGFSFEEQLAADKARTEAAQAMAEAAQKEQKRLAEWSTKGASLRATAMGGSFDEYEQQAQDLEDFKIQIGVILPKVVELKEEMADLWIPPVPAIGNWQRFSRTLENLFRGQGGIFPSISAGFAQFKREASTLSEVTTGATVNMLRNFQTGLAGAYQNLIFGGDDEKARKRAIDALKDIRTEAASLALDVFGQQGELGTKEVSIIDTLFGMADQQGLPEGTKNRIAQLKVQMLSIETPQQQTAFGESITSMIDQLESQGGFLGRLKEFGKTMASNVSTSFQEGIAAMLAQATMDMLGLGRGGYTITFVGNFIDNVSREISHIGGKAIDITANLVGDAWDKVGIIANLTSKAVTFSFNALMEGNALLWESIFKIGDWAAEGGKAVINVGGNMLESYTRVMDSLGNFIDKTIKVAANVVRNPGDAWEKIQELGNRIIRVGAIVVRGAGDAWDRVQEFGAKVISVSSVALQRTGDAWEKIQEFGSKIINIYSIAKERAGDAWEKIKEFGAKSFEVTANIAGIAWDRVREFSEKSFSVMATVAGDAWDKIKEFTPKDIKVLATAAGSAFERIGEFTQKTFNVIANVGNDPGEAWTRIREFTQKTFNVIANLAGDAWEKVKEFGPTTKEFFVKAKKYADSGLTDLWEGIKSFSGIKEFSVRAIKSGAGLADDAWEGISKIAGWVNDGIHITAALDNLADFGSRVSDLFKEGMPTSLGIKDNLSKTVFGAFVGANIASIFLPGHPQAEMIGSALGALVGSAFGSPMVGGAIGGLLGGLVDKLFFSSEGEKATGRYKEFITDIQAFGGVKGYFERTRGKEGIKGERAELFFDSQRQDDIVNIIRIAAGATKEQADGVVRVLRGWAAKSIDPKVSGFAMGIASNLQPQVINVLRTLGFSEEQLASVRFGPEGSAAGPGEVSSSPAPLAKPIGPLEQAQQLLRNARLAGNMKLSRGALRNLGWAGVVSQAINDVGMPWPQVGFALRSVTQGLSIPGDADERYIKDQTGVEIVARYGLGRVPGAEGQPMPAIVHGGEQILSAPQVRAGMGADGDVNLNTTIVVQDMGGGVQSARQTGDAIWRELEPRLEDFLRRKSRWGHLNYSERSLRTVLQ